MTLDDSVLRGFCQKCNHGIECRIDSDNDFLYYHSNNESSNCPYEYDNWTIVPVWFLNAKQMKTISSHKLFAEFGKGNYRFSSTRQGAKPHLVQRITTLCDFLDTNPFLVAKILKENDKK